MAEAESPTLVQDNLLAITRYDQAFDLVNTAFLNERPRAATPSIPTPSRVLQSEDILECIFSHFEPEFFFDDSLTVGYLDQSTRKALLFASLTCRSFLKPASDLLWRNMESLTPLFKILPTFEKVNQVYTFTGAIQPDHMHRMEMYARKIRVLRVENLPDKLAGHCIHRFSSIPDLDLFPALKKIALWTRLDQNSENFNPLFLAHGNQLTSINIRHINPSNESLISTFLLHLSHKASAIQEIDLSGELSSEILNFLKVFKKLRIVYLSVDSSTFPISALEDLRDLPDLYHLQLQVNGSEGNINDATSQMRGGNGDYFQALHVLDYRGNPREMLKVLHFIYEAPQLDDISIYLTTNPPPPPLSVQRCIEESCRIASNLKNFKLDTLRRAIVPSSNILSPLIQCRKLTSLQLFNISLPLNDDQICEFGESGAWQNLRILYLPPPSNQALLPTTSLTSLRILAQNCPNLTSLTIPIDFKLSSYLSIQEERLYPRTSHPLEFLAISKTNFDSSSTPHTKMAIHVARFLEHYFPKLGESQMELTSYVQGDAQWWSIVKANIAEYRDLRAEVKSELRQQIRAEVESELRQQLNIAP